VKGIEIMTLNIAGNKMTKIVGKTAALSALCLVFAAPSVALAKDQSKDTIILVGGKSIKDVTVNGEAFAEVKYRAKSSSKTIEGKKILEIVHGKAPRAYKAGEGQRKGGQYEKAIAYYKRALKASGAKPWVKIYANFYLGECYRLGGKSEGAVSFYKKACADKAHLLYPRALIGLAQAQAATRSWSDAIKNLTKISEGRYGLWRVRADYALGKVYISQNKMSEARRAFARVQSNRDDKSMKVAGVVGEGETYVAEKKYKKAIDFFRKILRRTGVPREVMAGAWAGIGDCEMARSAKGDKEADRRALLAYLTVIVQFAGAPEAYPKALFNGAKLYDKFGKKAQAQSLRRELKSRCPTSEYAKRA
jgi:tetratricopeptide (TPR) repeat protein